MVVERSAGIQDRKFRLLQYPVVDLHDRFAWRHVDAIRILNHSINMRLRRNFSIVCKDLSLHRKIDDGRHFIRIIGNCERSRDS